MVGVRLDGRIFKTAWFAKRAKKVRISDAELCEAEADLLKEMNAGEPMEICRDGKAQI